MLISFEPITSPTTAATKSAIGPAYIIPLIPINIGRTTKSGKKKIICLVKERKTPFFGLPIEVKKFATIG